MEMQGKLTGKLIESSRLVSPDI